MFSFSHSFPQNAFFSQRLKKKKEILTHMKTTFKRWSVAEQVLVETKMLISYKKFDWLCYFVLKFSYVARTFLWMIFSFLCLHLLLHLSLFPLNCVYSLCLLLIQVFRTEIYRKFGDLCRCVCVVFLSKFFMTFSFVFGKAQLLVL